MLSQLLDLTSGLQKMWRVFQTHRESMESEVMESLQEYSGVINTLPGLVRLHEEAMEYYNSSKTKDSVSGTHTQHSSKQSVVNTYTYLAERVLLCRRPTYLAERVLLCRRPIIICEPKFYDSKLLVFVIAHNECMSAGTVGIMFVHTTLIPVLPVF